MPLRRFLNNLEQELQNAAQGLGLNGGGPGYTNYGYGQPHPPNNYGQPLASASQIPGIPAPCPRIIPSAQYHDYFTLSQSPNFRVCPTCFNSQVRSTPFASHFVQAQPVQYPIRCDLSRFWVKVAGACLLTSPRKYEIEILARVAAVRSQDGPCPNSSLTLQGQQPVIQRRQWFTLQEAQGWTVCGECVLSMGEIWPELKGAWQSTHGQGSCGLVTSERYDDKNTMETLKPLLSSDDGVNALLTHLRENLPILDGQCPRNRLSPPTLRCHIIPSLPDFTVCEACFNEVIKPSTQQNLSLALQFSIVPQPVQGRFSCQLYSPRMRQIWQQTSQQNDLNTLRAKVNERKTKERELEMKKMQLKQKAAQLKMQAETQEHLAANAMRVETQRLNNQAAMLKLEAAGAEDQIRMAEEEWRRYWE
ncbi:hypothetical protein QBC44DRAFT_238088 [Cladorrhinum sp. PSN332]|nr:hypothetical protein QBC44DRAFT_238088 [Cladorrhinum sp. PSN332]